MSLGCPTSGLGTELVASGSSCDSKTSTVIYSEHCGSYSFRGKAVHCTQAHSIKQTLEGCMSVVETELCCVQEEGNKPSTNAYFGWVKGMLSA